MSGKITLVGLDLFGGVRASATDLAERAAEDFLVAFRDGFSEEASVALPAEGVLLSRPSRPRKS